MAYRKKGWALDQLDKVEQCKDEVDIEKMSKEEGCQVSCEIILVSCIEGRKKIHQKYLKN